MIKVTYIDHMGSDLKVVNAARVSFDTKACSLGNKDIKLINYLASNKHFSPFEHCNLTVLIECPLFIRSQIQRHRTFSYNERSFRYTSDNITIYCPSSFKEQAKENKQCSGGILERTKQQLAKLLYSKAVKYSQQIYEGLLKLGVSKEQARMILPVSTMTKFYMTGNLRNWIHFIKLRDHPHAQEEVQIIARQIKNILLQYYPESTKALMEVNDE